jgi:hypothetical protein
MKKHAPIIFLTLGLLSSGSAFAGKDTEAAVGGALGGVMGSVVGGHLGGSTGAAIGAIAPKPLSAVAWVRPAAMCWVSRSAVPMAACWVPPWVAPPAARWAMRTAAMMIGAITGVTTGMTVAMRATITSTSAVGATTRSSGTTSTAEVVPLSPAG